ncbi:MAG: bis(5'-nucleosyl)-tetraphosphatase (symmetrical) YqeK [bacterium]
MIKREIIVKKLQALLDQERFEHSLRVEQTAIELAKKFGVSEEKAGLAGLLHDYARQFDRPQLLVQAKKHALTIDPVSQQEPKLLHAELSAHLVKHDFGISDPEILSAISKHTLGSPAMTDLEKIIYLADHLEEGRDYPGVEKLRTSAENNPNQAIAAITSHMLEYLRGEKLPIHPAAIATRDYYLQNL